MMMDLQIERERQLFSAAKTEIETLLWNTPVKVDILWHELIELSKSAVKTLKNK